MAVDRDELKRVFDIDKDQLDVEWVEQPKLYFQYAMNLADVNAEVERAESRLDLIHSRLTLDIRRDPKAFGFGRVSDKTIEAAILKNKEYRIQLKALNHIRHEADVTGAVVKALDHRKKALENLVFLHGQNYFATPRVSGQSRDAMEDVVKRSVRRRNKGDEDND